MLDIFGNLLGKSKKSSTQQQANGSGGGGGGQTDDSTANENDSYVFVNHNNSAPYPQTTILTDEVIIASLSLSIFICRSLWDSSF